MIMSIRTPKNLLFLPLLITMFLLPFYFLSLPVGAAPDRADCNTTSQSNKCKNDFDDCRDNACKADVIRKYNQQSQIGVGGNGNGTGGGNDGTITGKYQCGNLPDEGDNVKTKFNFGCLGDKAPLGMGPIQDLIFAIIRFLSIGVGIAVTVSMIMAGVQYSTAEGSPEATQKAKKRIQNAMIGLLLYIFAFSILQFLIPGGIFKS